MNKNVVTWYFPIGFKFVIKTVKDNFLNACLEIHSKLKLSKTYPVYFNWEPGIERKNAPVPRKATFLTPNEINCLLVSLNIQFKIILDS